MQTQGQVRSANLAAVLARLRDDGPRSRARLAADTGLTKATVSSLVGELVDRGLVADGALHRPGSVGRPGTLVELGGRGVCGVGVEVNVDYLAVLVLDLRGEVRAERRLALDVAGSPAGQVLDAVTTLVRAVLADVDATPVGLTVAVPGSVQGTVVATAPNLPGWPGLDVAAGLAGTGLPVTVANDADLSALAEWSAGPHARTPDLVYLTGEVGVGGGVVSGGRLLRGSTGLGGEVGHLALTPGDAPCGCGRRGCWETVVGLGALLRAAADPGDPLCDPGRDLEDRLAEVVARARAGDARTLAALTDIGTGLGVGAAVLVSLLDPAVVVLGGYFAVVGEFLLDPLTSALAARVEGPRRVVLSTLGFTAAVRGGAHVALQPVFHDPTTVPLEASA
ncbi:ROK family transcriptional regulator [Modestobacter sp. Leaf380]|uniref:ROK family transcriptional regulator n=1 Tax=Modestobacter sp. Leaf380 TaxID=1736356 RepID=UPI0009E70289|nr:ROK family transcriptional regulator [Modestobacter sp. Leaf380]